MNLSSKIFISTSLIFGQLTMAGTFTSIDQINFKKWSDGLHIGAVSNLNSISVDKLYSTYSSSRDYKSFYNELLKLRLNKNLRKKSDYFKVSDKLLALKKKIRLESNTKKSSNAASLLTLLAEETMNAAVFKFPKTNGKRNIYKQVYANDTSDCLLDDNKKTAKILGIDYCQGDIFLSKGGAGSSSYLARSMELPGSFSHSTVAYVNPEKKNNIYMAEAEIDDGVKLRDSKSYYENIGMVKFYVYRYKNSNKVKQKSVRTRAIKAVDKFVASMKKRTNDVYNTASFEYDFFMDPSESEKLFCSEIPYVAYEQGGLSDSENPYPKSVWNKLKSDNFAFTSNFLELGSQEIPAPSDLERNKNYDLVSIVYDLDKLRVDRYDLVFIDTLLNNVLSDERLNEILKVIGKIGNLDIDQAIAEIKKLNIVDPKKLDGISKKIPDNVSLKHLVFFGVLNEYLTPKVRGLLSMHESAFIKKYNRPMDLNTLRSILVQAKNSIL